MDRILNDDIKLHFGESEATVENLLIPYEWILNCIKKYAFLAGLLLSKYLEFLSGTPYESRY